MMRFKIGETYNGFIIKEKFHKNVNGKNALYYKCECEKCHNITEKHVSNIMKRKCGICANQIIMAGKNDFLTVHPEFKKYICDIKDAQKYSAGSGHKIKVRCPICGFEKYIAIHNLVIYGFSCNHCSDGFSFPNKFICNLLMQSDDQFEPEKQFSWSDKRKYDFFINSSNTIIEVNGKQHYSKNGFISLGGKTLEDEINNDKYKMELALKNGIKNYIIIDCYKSDFDYIKKSIMKTDFFKIIHYSKSVNWKKCLKYATTNLMKEICNLYSISNLTASQIALKYKITKQTVISYLKCGNIIGICKYNPQENMSIRGREAGLSKRKRVICYEFDNIIFSHTKKCCDFLECNLNVTFNENNVRAACRGKFDNKYKNYHFLYYDTMKTADLLCNSIEEGTGRNKGKLGALVCDYKGYQLKVGTGFSDEDRIKYWKNPEEVIGRIVSVKYKEETKNKDGGISIQFPVFECVRFDKSEPSYDI